MRFKEFDDKINKVIVEALDDKTDINDILKSLYLSHLSVSRLQIVNQNLRN